jgi:acetyltransferase-like isoleucine patch superfamily enzyme
MKIYKLFWTLRGLIYKLFFHQFGFPSYIGKPIGLLGIRRVVIGRRVRIQPGLRMETHKNGWIKISEDVSIGQNFHIISNQEVLSIGAHTTISACVFITNVDHDYQQIGVHIMLQPMIVKKTEIGENCFIGYGAAIQAGTTLGRQCVVGANSVVRGVFPDYCVIVGAPARIVKRYNAEIQQWQKTNNLGEFINEL